MRYIRYYSRFSCFVFLLIICFGQISCKKYLDAKSDQTLVVPSNLQDMQALLDYEHGMPILSEIAADNYYVSSNADLALIPTPYREYEPQHYIWYPDASTHLEWFNAYRAILYANTVLDGLTNIPQTASNQADWERIKGSALFLRSYCFYALCQEFCKPYDPSTATTDLGIPLRLHSGIGEVSVRASVQQSYDQIIDDLKEAASLLPVNSVIASRPTKAAAFGALARTYLSMRNYVEAGYYADACLQLHNDLLDYNTLDSTINYPIPSYNQEVIFHATSTPAFLINNGVGNVDSNLYRSYASDDLRKVIFFTNKGNNTYRFTGTYDGSFLRPFSGIATDEMYLIRAECFAHADNKDAAMNDLNDLLRTRWKKINGISTYVDQSATDATDALNKILIERRKELCFRGLRWTDLRRFNLDGANISLQRVLDGVIYTLPPDDPRWVLLIPPDAVALSGMPQNPRNSSDRFKPKNLKIKKNIFRTTNID